MRLTLQLLSSVSHRRPFYVTTPIFYVNAGNKRKDIDIMFNANYKGELLEGQKVSPFEFLINNGHIKRILAPHLGHLYTAVVADAIQRFEKLTNPNCNVIFSTGTDEHGTKIQQAAAKANLSPSQYCTNISNEYRDLFRDYNIDYTDFIRTTENRHKKAVTHFWKKLTENDYVYKAKYSGWYSVNDESFVPETHLKDEQINGEMVKVSIESGHKVEWTEETNYMFRLSAFKTNLQNWLKNDGVITPAKFQKQVQDMLEGETYFPDISVSRPSSRVHWAIRVPGDEEQSIYVWLDALINYLTVCGYPDEEEMKLRGRPWPADVHVVGKDILKFHGIYWPAFLMAVRWHPPRRLVCHSHWTVDGVKMSKSLGNVVAPSAVGVAPAALRYMLLREATMHSDANYSETKLLNIVNSELADTLGNLASRCCGTALNPRGEYPPLLAEPLRRMSLESSTNNLLTECSKLPEACYHYYTSYQFYKVVDSVMHVLHLANLFFETHKPWKLKKNSENQPELDTILHITLETLRICGIILQPIIPDLCERLLNKLQVDSNCRSWQHCVTPSWNDADAISEMRNIQGGKFVLFQRIYKDKKEVVKPDKKDKKEKHKKKVTL